MEVRLRLSAMLSNCPTPEPGPNPALFPFHFGGITLLDVFDSSVKRMIQSGFLL